MNLYSPHFQSSMMLCNVNSTNSRLESLLRYLPQHHLNPKATPSKHLNRLT